MILITTHRRARIGLAGALIAGALALTAAQADAAYTPAVKDRTLLLAGDAAGERLALRTATTTKLPTLEADVGDDGSADFQIALSRFDRVRVLAGDGNDTVRVESVPLPVQVDGQGGADTLSGGIGAETLSGGAGDDTVVGGRGDDTIDLGDGDDGSVWNAGDGDDRVEGAADFDTLTVYGSGADEQIRLTTDGARARLTRDIGPVAIDTGTVERLDVEPLGGRDTLTLDDLTGTAVTELRADLEAVKDGNAPDTDADRLILNGTSHDDITQVLTSGGSTFVLGLPTAVAIQRLDPTRDALAINGLAGNDRIDANSSPVALLADGGAGNDNLTGSDGADELIGGAGRDFVDGQRGADTALLGEGDDTLAWTFGDGGDRVEGQAGTDALRMSGSAQGETFQASAAGTRLRVTRSNANGAETVDAGDVEQLSAFSFGGSDTLIVNDLTASGLEDVDASLFDFGVPGGNQDVVIANGSAGGDTVRAASDANGVVDVTGLAARIRVTGSEPAGDRLEVNGLGGHDSIDSTDLAAARMRMRADGGAGDDVLVGGAGDDVDFGGDGADVIFAGSGDNVALGGAGDDILRGEEGDDVLDGGAGDDILIGNAGDDILLNGEVVFDV